MRLNVRTLFSTIVVLAVGVSAAQAAAISYDSRASWQAAVTGPVSTTFEQNAPGTFTFLGAGPVVLDGITYSVNAGFLYTVDPLYNDAYSVLGTGDVLSAQGGASILTVDVAGATAFGFDWHSLGGPFMNVFLSTGDAFSIPAVAGATGFFGITSTVPVSSFTIQVPGILNIDNFSVGSEGPAAVPEPATLLLVGGPLAICLRRRLRRKTA
ncbi:MAG TPA: hypothetical protein VIY56_05265 [Vicinamibacterales bacterium]